MDFRRFLEPGYWAIVLNRNYWKTKHSIVLVYNPSKVGSSTVYFSLKECLVWMPIAHLHYLNKDWLALFRERGINNWKNNIQKEQEVRRLLAENQHRRIKIITLIRDPIAIELSSIFQVWKEVYAIDDPEQLREEDVLDTLRRKRFDWLQTWYEKEFKTFTGVDVTLEPFDSEKGYAIYTSKDMDMLLMKLEDFDRVKDEAMLEFLGVKRIKWLKRNTTKDKRGISELYSSVKKRFGLDEEHLERIYSNDFMRTFYSEEELKTFRWRWSSESTKHADD